jgi:hypothetical protein
MAYTIKQLKGQDRLKRNKLGHFLMGTGFLMTTGGIGGMAYNFKKYDRFSDLLSNAMVNSETFFAQKPNFFRETGEEMLGSLKFGAISLGVTFLGIPVFMVGTALNDKIEHTYQFSPTKEFPKGAIIHAENEEKAKKGYEHLIEQKRNPHKFDIFHFRHKETGQEGKIILKKK